MNLLGALPARFRRERVLIMGCGDVGQRAVRVLGSGQRARLLALTSSAERVAELARPGRHATGGQSGRSRSLRRLAGLATRVLHLAPPPTRARRTRTTRAPAPCARALMQRSCATGAGVRLNQRCLWRSAGRLGERNHAVQPASPRAWRRVDAEASVLGLGRSTGVRTTVLRIPGIYAPDREGGTPRGRACSAAHRCCARRTTCSPTTSMRTIWPGPACWPCGAAGRSVA